MGFKIPSGSEKNGSIGAPADSVWSSIELDDAAAGSSKNTSTTANRSSMYILSNPVRVTRSCMTSLRVVAMCSLPIRVRTPLGCADEQV